MPEADRIDTRNPSSYVAGVSFVWSPGSDRDVILSVRHQPDESELIAACYAAATRGELMTLIGLVVADLPPSDPRHEASYAVIERLRPEWVAQVDRIATLAAHGSRGLYAKASLVASLTERDEDDRVQGPPALRIAASLADDLLVLSTS